MTAGEDEPQPVVRDRAHLVSFPRLDRGKLGLDLRVTSELLGLLGERSPAAKAINRPVPGGGRDPRSRVVRHASLGPGLERGHERLLNGLLGEVEVAEDPNERRNSATRLFLEEAIDDGVSRAIARGAGSLRRWESGQRLTASEADDDST
jgi:hypothetical protein